MGQMQRLTDRKAKPINPYSAASGNAPLHHCLGAVEPAGSSVPALGEPWAERSQPMGVAGPLKTESSGVTRQHSPLNRTRPSLLNRKAKVSYVSRARDVRWRPDFRDFSGNRFVVRTLTGRFAQR